MKILSGKRFELLYHAQKGICSTYLSNKDKWVLFLRTKTLLILDKKKNAEQKLLSIKFNNISLNYFYKKYYI